MSWKTFEFTQFNNCISAALFAKVPYCFSGVSVRSFFNLHTEIVAFYAAVLAKFPYYFSGDELDFFTSHTEIVAFLTI